MLNKTRMCRMTAGKLEYEVSPKLCGSEVCFLGTNFVLKFFKFLIRKCIKPLLKCISCLDSHLSCV